MEREFFTLERVRQDAALVVIRLGLGAYVLRGPRENVLEPESYVAWSTVANELAGEGYALVSPEEYAATCGLTKEEVRSGLWREGRLFALAYGDGSAARIVVPLPEKEVRLGEMAGSEVGRMNR